MRLKKILILSCLFLFQNFYSSNRFNTVYFFCDSILQTEIETALITQQSIKFEKKRPNPLLQIFHLKEKNSRKLTAAILAFPFPFGIVGLHRIYLGCPPYVPVVYIASFGGALGLLPLIDFCFILLDKNTETFVNNKKVFMWVN